MIYFITYCFPPIKFPRAPQIAHLVHGLKDTFNIKTFAADIPFNLDESLNSLVDDAATERVPYGALSKWVYHSRGNKIKQWILPDAQYLWIRDLLKVLESKIKPNDTIVTFGQPMSVHTVGLKLKRKIPSLTWLANFSDPWVKNPYSQFRGLSKWTNHYYENAVFQKADRLLFNSKETLEHVLSDYESSVKAKARWLPHSFRNDLYPKTEVSKEGPFIIRYLGNFYGNRQPDFLEKVCQTIYQKSPDFFKHCRIELIGQYDKTAPLLNHLPFTKGSVQFLDSVDYLTSLKYMSESQALLLIDAPAKQNIFFPSKLVDYIGSGRPIYGITPPGTSQKIIEALGFETTSPEAIETIAEKLILLPQKYKDYQMTEAHRLKRQEFSAEVVCDTMRQILNECKLTENL